VAGVFVLLTLSGNLGHASYLGGAGLRTKESTTYAGGQGTIYATIYAVNLRTWLLGQTALFISGVGLSIAYGFTSLY
jgi:hypothetical protein